MSQDPTVAPYRSLGKKLKALRVQTRETIAEASEAVEIEARQLASYEMGQDRPSETVLLLLMSHFGAKDDEAIGLWKQAGYGTGKLPSADLANGKPNSNDNPAANRPILFTDTVDVVVNPYGVVMNFMQNSSTGDQPVSITRVGMSREHAKSVMRILQITLAQTEGNSSSPPKRINSPELGTTEDNSRS